MTDTYLWKVLDLLRWQITSVQQRYSTLRRRFRGDDKQDVTSGINVVYDGGSCNLDIVCVHGLGFNSQSSWTTTVGDKDFNWVQDLLKEDFPDARIMTYGYQSERFILRHFSKTLQAESNQLLKDLECRREDEAQQRPVIFIAHNLGGLIVKNALADAGEAVGEKEKPVKLIQLSTVGVLFFGTPHRYRNQKAWLGVLKRTMTAVSPQLMPGVGMESMESMDSVVTSNEAGSLSLLLNRYRGIEHEATNIIIIERKATKTKVGSFIVVDDEDIPKSKDDDTWIPRSLARSHSDLVKYEGRDDDGYKLVCTSIRDCLKKAPRVQPRCSDFISSFDGDEVGDPTRSSLPNRQSVRTDTTSSLSPQVVHAVNTSKRGQSVEAEATFYKALKHLERDEQATSVAVLEVWNELAHHYMRVGTYDKAELIYKRLFLSYYERSDLQNFRAAAEAIDRAALAAEEQGRHRSAMRLLERAKSVNNRCYGRSSRAAMRSELDTNARIAILHDELGNHVEAQRLYNAVYRERVLLLGESDSETLKVRENLAMSHKMQGKLDQAEQLLKEVLDRRKVVDERDHDEDGESTVKEHVESRPTCSYVGSTVMRLAAVLHEQGKDQEVVKLLEDFMAYPGVGPGYLQA